MKYITEYYKQNDYYRSVCKSCMKLKIDKKKKKVYDHNRYLKLKKKKIFKKKLVCMRCDKYVANVRNNELYWCFHCLEKYEVEWKQKIKVEILNYIIRKVK